MNMLCLYMVRLLSNRVIYFSQIPNVLEAVRDKLSDIQCPHTRKGTLLTFQNLANHHLSAVLVSLLNSVVPYDV